MSFGLNFNFDGASSPSNSDSGGKSGGDAGSSGDDDINGNAKSCPTVPIPFDGREDCLTDGLQAAMMDADGKYK